MLGSVLHHANQFLARTLLDSVLQCGGKLAASVVFVRELVCEYIELYGSVVCVVEEVAELYGAVVCVVEEVACSGCSCVFLTNEVTGWLNLLLLLQSALNLEKLFSQGELSEVSKPLVHQFTMRLLCG